LLTALGALPEQIEAIIKREPEIARLADMLLGCEHAYFVGRSGGYAVAMEGALKLKEVSYLHAEAYPASELKHGPLALISPETPTIVVIPRDDLFAKNLSTVEETRARRGPVIAITNPRISVVTVIGRADDGTGAQPILLNIPLQLLALSCRTQEGLTSRVTGKISHSGVSCLSRRVLSPRRWHSERWHNTCANIPGPRERDPVRIASPSGGQRTRFGTRERAPQRPGVKLRRSGKYGARTVAPR
jgi:hypothetical protein